MDILDKASDTEQRHLDAALSNHFGKNQCIGNDITECVDCGEDIPEVRKKLLPHTTLCVDCQQIKEHRRS